MQRFILNARTIISVNYLCVYIYLVAYHLNQLYTSIEAIGVFYIGDEDGETVRYKNKMV